MHCQRQSFGVCPHPGCIPPPLAVQPNPGRSHSSTRNRPAMALLSRIYFNAVFGGLGGLLGWLLLGVFCDKNVEQILLRGTIIGGAIGYFVVSVEALRDYSLV